MQIYPEKYDQLGLSSEEKSLLRTLERAYTGKEETYCVLHINPRKKIDGSTPELFDLLITDKGIILLRFYDTSETKQFLLFVKYLGALHSQINSDIFTKLSQSRYLLDSNGKLSFLYTVSFVFPKIDYYEIEKELTKEELAFCKMHVIFKNDLADLRTLGADGFSQLLIGDKILDKNIINNIFQRLCPEITIPQKVVISNNEIILGNDSHLTSSDRATRAYRLDNTQINIINKIAKGNLLILACAGSGKSVLLISKCFKLASLNPDKDFLITCYNRNLNNYYQWAIAQAGFIDLNVKCETFHAFCKNLLEKNNISLPIKINNQVDDEYFDRLFKTAENALAQGRIKERFYGIFIDEVQIFKPEWYRFCFNLLKSRESESHYFVIAGDKSQDIKNNIRNGKAPWQGGGEDYPEFRGKTIPIETNYRNSKPINDAIDRFVDESKTFGKTIGVDFALDPELFLRGTAFREGKVPKLIELKNYSNRGEAEAICREVKRLIDEENLSEVDIAIILYNETNKYTGDTPWDDKSYKLYPEIENLFEVYRWESLTKLKGGEGTYGSRSGVCITSIEGALGLDFKAVILAGLRPMGIHEGVRKKVDFFTNLPSDPAMQEKLEAYKKNVNLLYTGCTRAKDCLSIILDDKEGESIYIDLLRKSMGEN